MLQLYHAFVGAARRVKELGHAEVAPEIVGIDRDCTPVCRDRFVVAAQRLQRRPERAEGVRRALPRDGLVRELQPFLGVALQRQGASKVAHRFRERGFTPEHFAEVNNGLVEALGVGERPPEGVMPEYGRGVTGQSGLVVPDRLGGVLVDVRLPQRVTRPEVSRVLPLDPVEEGNHIAARCPHPQSESHQHLW